MSTIIVSPSLHLMYGGTDGATPSESQISVSAVGWATARDTCDDLFRFWLGVGST